MSKEKVISSLGPVFDTHEHFSAFGSWRPSLGNMTLEKIFNGAYVGIGQNNDDYDQMCAKLKRYIGSNLFHSLKLSLREIYEIDIYPLSPKKLEALDKQIREAYKDPNHTINILKNKGNIKRFILDIPPEYWGWWNDSMIERTIRIDEVIFPFLKVRTGVYSINPNEHQVEAHAKKEGLSLDSLDDFDDALDEYVMSLRPSANVIKIGSAYQRSINFLLEENDDGGITRIYKKIKGKKEKLNETEMRRWGNYIVTFLCSYATVEKIPVQIHTGLASMAETSPNYLTEIMGAFRGTSFDLFHGGYPFHHSVPGLLMTNSNAHVDLCWMPTLNQTATKRLLHEVIELGVASKTFAYGGDCQNAEGSYGALLVLKDILAEVLVEKMEKRELQFQDAMDIGNQLLHDNALSFYTITKKG